jgi:hypothetical protein
MHKIQGRRGISFAGAYLRYGFHEDGFTSGLVAAASLSSPGSSLGVNPRYLTEKVSMTVRPPFRIEYANQDVKKRVLGLMLMFIFDLVETSGVRWLVGMVGSTILGVIRWAL